MFAQKVSRTRAFRIGTTQIGGDGPPYFLMARTRIAIQSKSGSAAWVVTLLVLPTIYVLMDDMWTWARGS